MEKLSRVEHIIEELIKEDTHIVLQENELREALSLGNEGSNNIGLKILSIIGGFLATLAFLGFVAISGIYESEIALIIMGVIGIFGSVYLAQLAKNTFLKTLAIVSFISGFALFAAGFYLQDLSIEFILISCSALAFASLLITKDYVLVFLSTLFGILSISSIGQVNHSFNYTLFCTCIIIILVFAVTMLEVKWMACLKKINEKFAPIRAALWISMCILLFLYESYDRVGRLYENLNTHSVLLSVLFTVVISLLFISLIYNLIQSIDYLNLRNKVKIYSLCIIILASGFFAPVVTCGYFMILLGFSKNYKTGFILGCVTLVSSMSMFYYDMDISLLYKSGLLILSGLAFLLLYFITQKSAINNG